MRSLRRLYYDLFSEIYDLVIRLHSRDREGSVRTFLAEKANVLEGDRVLDLCAGTGSVAIEMTRRVGEKGLVVALDFSRGMLGKAKEKAKDAELGRMCLVQANASELPFKDGSFHGATCSHAFYELKRIERIRAVEEVARVLKKGGKFCLMEHSKPEELFMRILFYIRLFFLGSKDARQFLMEERSIFGARFENIVTIMSPTGKSKLIYGEKGG
jgi:demethylmenaquinone methyltransferase / 2-methoxy-6-polyprenyl-1,4-benzoquinol methylase